MPKSNLLERRDAKVGLGATGTKVLSSTHLYDAKGNLTDVQNMRQAPFNVAVLAHHYGLDVLNRREVMAKSNGKLEGGRHIKRVNYMRPKDQLILGAWN